jgi:hypothetical protein
MKRLQVLSKQEKLKAIAKAVQHQFPTADIDQMLAEISPVGGRKSSRVGKIAFPGK